MIINRSKDPKEEEESGYPIHSYSPGFMDGQPRGPQTVKEFAEVDKQKVQKRKKCKMN